MSIKDFLLDELGDYIEDIVNHGCQSGFPKLTYYSDTIKFYNEHGEEIWELINSCADESGETVLEFIASFNGANDVSCDKTFKNLLVWFAVEEIAREIMNEREEERAIDE